MEMHQVRYFLAVCETLNFTRAAEQCHVSQPSLTRAVQKLEEELGGELFHRERAHTHLTDLGRMVRPHLETILAAGQAAKAEATELRGPDRAPLKLGVMCTIGPTRLIPFFDRLSREVPNLELDLHEAPGRRLVELMVGGELDVALIGLPRLPDRLHAKPLFTERYVIAFARGHRFERLNAVPMRELDGERYLQRVNCEFADHFAELGVPRPFQVKVCYRTEREDWIQALILAGMGCAIVPEHLPFIPGIVTRVLIEPELSREVRLVTVAGRRFTPAEQVFVRLATRYDWNGPALASAA